ncbi:hypothetical protein SLS60_004348 [Paraconiothyrium brasiliense]|uniref:Peptidase S8/S53 domain-containing protein n=1 Tax=Paraconiothyrium brasiliense TaxID=300254 RepID=A0ABR3RK29_9PLEO
MASSGEASDFFSSDLLVKVAPLACQEVLNCASKKKPLPSVLGSRIGTALHLIARHLEVMQPFQFPATAQGLSRRALQDFLKICKWPVKSAAIKAEEHELFNDWLSSASSRGIYDELSILFSSRPVMMRAGFKNFLAAKQTDVEFYTNRFQELLDLLEPDNRKFDGTRQQLEGNEECGAKAIRHAGKEWEVDVISMSFGFPKSSQPISDAIHDVRKSRESSIVFLASAGNDVDRAEAYPACDPSVISIYATDSTGTFLKTNPIPSEDSRRLLGTYGDNVPDAVLAELRERFAQADFGAGTSVATAVAAGIVSLMLAYAALLPHVLRGCGAEGVYSDLKTTDGMRHMLFGMAKSWNALQYFVNLILFLSYKSDDSSMYRGMCRALPQKEVMR